MHKILDKEVVIVSGARTPVGRFDGILRDYGAVELGGVVIGGVVRRVGIDPNLVEMVVMGNVVGGGFGEAPAKQAGLLGGLKEEVISKTVNAVCGSALEAVIDGVNAILVGVADVVIAGGMESRTNAPYLLGPKGRKNKRRITLKRGGAYRFDVVGDVEEEIGAVEIVDPTTYDGLFWPVERKFMREYALQFAKKMGFTLAQVNECAAESHRKAKEATEKGWFKEEIVAVNGVDEDDLLSVEKQEEILFNKPDDMASLYNTSTPADAAAVVLIMSGEKARELGVKPLARILGYGLESCAAGEFLAAPVRVVDELVGGLRNSGYPTDFTIIEVNEAFGIQLPLFKEKFRGMAMNVHGGAIALGHPLGAAGVRLLVTLLYAMKRYGHKRGLEAICFGGGGAYGLAVERA